MKVLFFTAVALLGAAFGAQFEDLSVGQIVQEKKAAAAAAAAKQHQPQLLGGATAAALNKPIVLAENESSLLIQHPVEYFKEQGNGLIRELKGLHKEISKYTDSVRTNGNYNVPGTIPFGGSTAGGCATCGALPLADAAGSGSKCAACNVDNK